jgi:hypothetical protein
MKNSFEEQMSLMDDIDLVQLVVNRNDYEEGAVNAAITEALKRVLINSDLSPIESVQQQIDRIPEIEQERKTESFMQSSKGCLLIIIAIVIFILASVAAIIHGQVTGRMNLWLYNAIGIVVFLLIRNRFNQKKTTEVDTDQSTDELEEDELEEDELEEDELEEDESEEDESGENKDK